jgi:hypothetical protein
LWQGANREDQNNQRSLPGEKKMTTTATTLRGIMISDYTTLRGIMISDYTTLRGIMISD